MSAEIDPPLAGIRVVDLVRGPLAPITRYLAELGAQVDRIEAVTPPTDDLADIVANLGKRRHVGSVADAWVQDLLTTAHVIVADTAHEIDLAALRNGNPRLVTMHVSDFGRGNSFSGWAATDAVLHALSGELSRSGLAGRAPLIPPGALAYQTAISQAAYALMTSLFHALRTGVGDHIDFSALDGAVQALDPGYGIAGSATMGKPAHQLPRSRPPKGFQYPIFPCADGFVRICLLAKRQWRGMYQWMGAPAQFASPDFDQIGARYKSAELQSAIADFFRDKPRLQLEADGQSHGVPISAVLTLEESVASDHVRARAALRDMQLDDGSRISLPNGVISIDGARMAPVTHSGSVPAVPTPTAVATTHAFHGLKVLDLGVIVVGAEQGRLFGDQGADVIKLESRAYPDGNRQSYLSYGLSVSFAAGHRNKRSLGLNLRDPDGKALFLRLAAQADIILSNFKPGTLEGLGLGYDEIVAINPRIVMADSSAFGASGPWSDRMGYGPLVRAATGLTSAWRYDDDAQSFSDSITIYPDHVAARIGAIATIALLIRRLRTGRGGAASVAQSEVMLHHFAIEVARLSRGQTSAAPDWPCGAYLARGDDEWCVVSIRHARDWCALCDVIGFDNPGVETREQRLAARAQIDRAIEAWMADRDPHEAAALLQARGVPAAPMLRLADLPTYRYYVERGFYRVEDHPFLKERVIAERTHAHLTALADPETRPAPLMGEQTAEIIQEWLGLSAAECQVLVASGVLEPVEAAVLEAATAGKAG